MSVYFLRPIGMAGPVKVGASSMPANRLLTYLKISPFPLEIAATCDGAEYEERQFHALFAAHFSHHEWFHAAPEITAAIDAINAGTFDFSALPSGSRRTAKPYRSPESLRHQSVQMRVYWADRRGHFIPPSIRCATHARLTREEKSAAIDRVEAFLATLPASPPLSVAA